jgi:regulator of sigma D
MVDLLAAIEAQKEGYIKRGNKTMEEFCNKLLEAAKEEV